MFERLITRLVDRWEERRRPKHNTQLALTAHTQALRDLNWAKADTTRSNIWRGVRLVLLVVMLLAAISVAWYTFAVISWDELTSLPMRDLLRKIFRR